jgi:hypothetical protein
MSSYAAYVILPGEAPATNALRFPTYQEADSYGFDLLTRWFAPEDYEVRQTEDKPNYRWTDQGAKRIDHAP